MNEMKIVCGVILAVRQVPRPNQCMKYYIPDYGNIWSKLKYRSRTCTYLAERATMILVCLQDKMPSSLGRIRALVDIVLLYKSLVKSTAKFFWCKSFSPS